MLYASELFKLLQSHVPALVKFPYLSVVILILSRLSCHEARVVFILLNFNILIWHTEPPFACHPIVRLVKTDQVKDATPVVGQECPDTFPTTHFRIVVPRYGKSLSDLNLKLLDVFDWLGRHFLIDNGWYLDDWCFGVVHYQSFVASQDQIALIAGQGQLLFLGIRVLSELTFGDSGDPRLG